MQHSALIPVTLDQIRAASPNRRPGYEAAVLGRGKLEGQTVWLTPETHHAIREEFTLETGADIWPGWAVVASLFRGPWDRGVGDTVARELGGATSPAFKAHHEAIFGLWAQPCGCRGKVAEWNRVFGYDRPPEAQPGAPGAGPVWETQGAGDKGGI